MNSRRISRVPRYSGIQTRKTLNLLSTGLSPSLALFPVDSIRLMFCNFPKIPEDPLLETYYPDPTALLDCNVEIGLGCSPFARHY